MEFEFGFANNWKYISLGAIRAITVLEFSWSNKFAYAELILFNFEFTLSWK